MDIYIATLAILALLLVATQLNRRIRYHFKTLSRTWINSMILFEA